jgi:hypothetical protein
LFFFFWVRLLILSVCFVFTLIAVNAEAGLTHSHNAKAGAHVHAHADQAVSPFGDKLGNNRLHCELLGHNPLLPCPHHKMPSDKQNDCFLSNECGGGPFSASAYRSAGDYPRFLVPPVTADEDLPFFAYVLSTPIIYNVTVYHSLDRPPQAL